MDLERTDEDQESAVPYYANVMSSPDDGEVSDSSGEKDKMTNVVKPQEADAKKTEREDEEKRLRRKLLEKRARKKRESAADEDEPLSVQPVEQMQKKRRKSPVQFPPKDNRERDQRAGRHRHEHERQRHHRDRLESAEKKPAEVKTSRSADPSEDPKVKEGWTQWKQGLAREDERRSKSKEIRPRVEGRRSPHRHHSKHTHSRSPKRDSSRREPSASGWLPKTRKSPHSREPSEKKEYTLTSTTYESTQVVVVVEAEGTPTQDEKEDKGSELSSSSSDKHTSPAVDSDTKMKKEKYSKFESSPEMSDASPDMLDGKANGRGAELDDIDMEDEDKSDGELVDEDDNEDTNAVAAEDDSHVTIEDDDEDDGVQLPIYFPGVSGCRSVEEFHCLNRIEEGTFGVVYRAKEKRTDEVVALKRLKMEKEKEGFPITSLREINMLLKAGQHPNVVNVREIVVGSNMDKIYLVMEYVEHDMKNLMEGISSRGKTFTTGEVKTLTRQLLAGVDHLHQMWILHRDLKTSNLLLSHRGILKIGDFGLAREYGEPLKPYTPIVVTLWYRSPELLLGVKEYSTAVDMWSVGCIFAEFLTLKPLFPGRGEMDQINRIFKTLGTPSDTIWPGYSDLPGPQKATFTQYPYNQLRKQFGANVLSDTGFQLLNKFLTYNPERRISALDALKHEWFRQDPLPVKPDMFPTWPAKSEGGKHPATKGQSPKAPEGGKQFESQLGADDAKLLSTLKVRPDQANKGFSLRFDAPKFR